MRGGECRVNVKNVTMSSRKVSKHVCVVVGCKNKYTNSPECSFYKFPSVPHKKPQREKWIGSWQWEEKDQHSQDIVPTSKSTLDTTSDDGGKIAPNLVQELFKGKTELGPDVLKDPKYNAILTPFDLQWIYGFNIMVPILNLSTKNYREVFYTASHMGVIYDICNKEMQILKGHQHDIISASIDKSCRWLVTADDGEEGCIMVWDAVFHKLVSTIFQHSHYGKILLVVMTPSAKNLIVICENDEEITINVWLWTYGKDIPDETCTYGESETLVPKSVQFHPNDEQHLMFIFDKEVAFFNLDTSNGKLYNQVKHPISSYKYGSLSCGTYMEFVHECFLATTKGNILLYGNTLYTKPWREGELDNNKTFKNCIKISKRAITCLVAVDECLVTSDDQGRIQFFSKNLGLLYWITPPETVQIMQMSFHRDMRRYKIETKYTEEISQLSGESLYYDTICRDQDRSEEYEILMKNDVPLDASLKQLPFVTRDLIISTMQGMYGVNVLSGKYIPLFGKMNGQVAAIEVHDAYPYLLVAFENGRLLLQNYETKEEVTSSVLEPSKEAEAKITTVKYSSSCLHLACGKDNGELWILQPIILTPRCPPFHVTKSKVVKIEFSPDNLQLFYYDAENTVCGFFYDAEKNEWLYKGKVRPHYKEIKHLLYNNEDPCGLYTIGEDRNLIYYVDLNLDSENITIQKRDRIEQRDIPLYFISHPKKKMSKSSHFLLADNKHKFKLLNAKTGMCINVSLGPAYGCWRDSPVSKMEFVPYSEKKYMIFMNKKHVGIQLMPTDGNPYKFLGCLAHPTELADFRISADGAYLFTIGKSSRSIFMWKVCSSAVEVLHDLGGDELDAFYCILDGGKNGLFFQEMQDLFYFKQILHQGENTVMPRAITNSMEIIELPDLVRSCGYYPSEYEIENMITDIRYRDYDENLKLRDKISFCDFVKLFINHKPAYGYQIDDVQDAFDMLTCFVDGVPTDDIERYDFVDAVLSTGESFTKENLCKCLMTLMRTTDTSSGVAVGEEFDFLPETIDFDTLLNDILGIDSDGSKSMLEITKEPGSEDDACF